MSKEPVNVSNRKFSISQINFNQSDNREIDPLYEFNAPKYFDLSTLPESPVGNDMKIDPWFFINHSHQSNPNKLSKNIRKKKYSQYKNEHNDDSSRKSECVPEKKKKPYSLHKMSLIKTFDTMNITKERSNNFKRSYSVIKTFDNIKKLKRGVSTDTYTYYKNKLNKESKEKENVDGNNKKSLPKIKITYCPRVHDAKIQKKWESMKGKKWYALSPESRAKANEEITSMIKTKAFDDQ